MECGSITTIPIAYKDIIGEVIEKSRVHFLEEGVDKDVLQTLKDIWLRKVAERNVTPSSPAIMALPAKTIEGKTKKLVNERKASVQKKPLLSKGFATFHFPPCISIFKDTKMNEGVCNRSMPLLTYEEEESEPTPIVKLEKDVKVIPEVKQQKIPVETNLSVKLMVPLMQNKETQTDLASSPCTGTSNDQKLLWKNNNIINKTPVVKLCKLSNVKEERPPIEVNNNVKQRRSKRLRKTHPVVEPIKRPRGRPKLIHNVLKINEIQTSNRVESMKKARGDAKHVNNVLKINEIQTTNVVEPVKKPRQLKRAKNVLKINETQTANIEPAKRLRGRPKLEKNLLKSNQKIANIVELAKRPRGRPKLEKNVLKINGFQQSNQIMANIVVPAKKPRGRPKLENNVLKINGFQQSNQKIANIVVPAKRPRGRPKLEKNVLKINGFQQSNQKIANTRAQGHGKPNSGKRFAIMKTDGSANTPKFDVKPKFTGIPVEINQKRLEEEELNSDDDITDGEDPSEPFECDNVVVCQYDKVKRTKNKWKIYLKHGIIHGNGKDYVFNSANCAVEW